MKNVSVQYLAEHTYAQRVTARRHTVVADEPADAGGEDLGPGPYELLLGALGSCTAMTLLMYARRHEWPLTDVSAELTHDRVYTDDQDLDKQGGRIEEIHQTVTLRGDLSEEQRARLQEIAGRCPVHRTLAGVRIVDHIVFEP